MARAPPAQIGTRRVFERMFKHRGRGTCASSEHRRATAQHNSCTLVIPQTCWEFTHAWRRRGQHSLKFVAGSCLGSASGLTCRLFLVLSARPCMEHRLQLTSSDQKLPGSVHIWLGFSNIWATSTNYSPMSAEFGPIPANFGPESTKVGPHSTNFW